MTETSKTPLDKADQINAEARRIDALANVLWMAAPEAAGNESDARSIRETAELIREATSKLKGLADSVGNRDPEAA